MYYGDRDETYDPTKNELSYKKFKLGEYGENNWNGSWERCYKGIYQASVFIHNIDINKEMTAEEILDYKGQARFVRAYYYWLLLRRYGPVPIVPDEGVDYTQSYDKIATPRSSYEEVAKFY
ncbi:RagB/SusD family nutrient uptake outer membrane protein [Bacteroides thetaiotaomicron]|uniref:RagB/SusD family nutrient uptake outer membrane protein n=1 Tax=Bacteroides thetaiotaomicron TaxID=818 RepID=UPI00286991E4|nr:RagB/SusD family nutrient uptake outer membrane protein [Bacteroides thetaiotaomicron]